MKIRDNSIPTLKDLLSRPIYMDIAPNDCTHIYKWLEQNSFSGVKEVLSLIKGKRIVQGLKRKHIDTLAFIIMYEMGHL